MPGTVVCRTFSTLLPQNARNSPPRNRNDLAKGSDCPVPRRWGAPASLQWWEGPGGEREGGTGAAGGAAAAAAAAAPRPRPKVPLGQPSPCTPPNHAILDPWRRGGMALDCPPHYTLGLLTRNASPISLQGIQAKRFCFISFQFGWENFKCRTKCIDGPMVDPKPPKPGSTLVEGSRAIA